MNQSLDATELHFCNRLSAKAAKHLTGGGLLARKRDAAYAGEISRLRAERARAVVSVGW